MVECNLAKVDVAGSNPVSRSKFLKSNISFIQSRSRIADPFRFGVRYLLLTPKTELALAGRICRLIRSLQSVAETQEMSFQSLLWPKPMQDTADELAEDIRKHWPDRFSTSYLKKRLRQIVEDLAADPIGQHTQERSAAFLGELECFAETKLCIAPVEGIQLVNDDPVTLGPFRLRRVTPEVHESIHAITVKALTYTLHTPSEQDALAKRFRTDAEYIMAAGNVIVEFEVVADSEHAHAVFFEKANALMDLLQMSTRVVEWCGSVRVGLRGGPHAGTYSAWVLPLNAGGLSQKNRLTGGIDDIVLDPGNLTLMERAGIMRLAESLGRNATPLEDSLLRAAHWFAQSTLQENASQGTFSLVVCLEAVLASSSGRVVAESVARLVGNTPAEKRYLYTLVLYAYGVRNVVVHEGRVNQDVSRQQEFSRAVQNFITTCIYLCDELKTPESLNQRIENLRFSVGVDGPE